MDVSIDRQDTPLAWIAAQTSTIQLGTAIMQMPARTPAMFAMQAMTVDQLSGGRMLVGLGPSGPQVVEGWHGQPSNKPLERTRECIAIMREIFKRERPVEFQGELYQMPYTGPGSSGLGKPLKSTLHDDLDACRAMLKPALALYVGGMGARDKNFYNSHIARQGWPAEAKAIQDLYLDGKKKEAAAAVPDDMVDGVALVGPVGRVRDKVAEWRETRATTLLVGGDPSSLEALAEMVL